MKKLLGFALLVAALAALGAAPAWAGKQPICHFPPGDPANFHTIIVGDNAVAAHVNNHGDLLGTCLDNCETICDDGNACTIDVVSDPDLCLCVAEPRPQVDCDDGNQCTADACDPINGTCTNDPGPLDGNACDDGDPNTTGEVCVSGSCVPPLVCPCADPEVSPIFAAVVAGEEPINQCTPGPVDSPVGVLQDGVFVFSGFEPIALAGLHVEGVWICAAPDFSAVLTPEQGQLCVDLLEQAANDQGVTCGPQPLPI